MTTEQADGPSRLGVRCCHLPRTVYLVTILGLISGCGGGGPAPPETAPLTGRVVLADGTPVVGADLLFAPTDESSSAITATARTEDEGHYTAKTHAVGKEISGAVPGDYVVIVRKFESRSSSEKLQEMSPEELTKLREDAATETNDTGSRNENVLPKQYASRDTTPLTAKVVVGEENEVIFELEK